MRLAPLAAVTALAAGALVGTVSPAEAGGTCSVKLSHHVVVDHPHTRIRATLGGDCAQSGATYASWDLYHHKTGWDGILIFDGTSTDYWDFYDWDFKGGYDVRASAAWDNNHDDVAQNSSSTTVKFASGLTLTARRSGSYVTLTAHATRYWPSTGTIRPWGGKPVGFSFTTRSGHKYHVATRTTGPKGNATVRVHTNRLHSYRAHVVGTPTVWKRTSRPQRA
jgi:hypothetical protein